MGWHGGHGGRKRKSNVEKGKGKQAVGKDKGKGSDCSNSQPSSKRQRPTGPLPEHAAIISSNSPALLPKAAREAIELLHSARDLLQPKKIIITDGENGADASQCSGTAQTVKTAGDLLEAELRELRGDPSADGKGEAAQTPRPRRITMYGEVSRGIAVLGWPRVDSTDVPFLEPSALVEQVFKSRKQGPESDRAVRFVVRMVPLDFVCQPHLKNFKVAAEAALPKAFAKAKPGATWYFAFHARAMTTIKREDALTAVKEILSPLGMEISVSEAEYMIVIEVNPALCGFSVVQQYEDSLHECNLQKACAAVASKHAAEDDNTSADSETGAAT